MDEIIKEARAYYCYTWPFQLQSDIMFFKGIRITRRTFERYDMKEVERFAYTLVRFGIAQKEYTKWGFNGVKEWDAQAAYFIRMWRVRNVGT